MTANMKKTATVAAVAATLVAVMLVYSTAILPASAQTATTSTSTSASIPNGNSNAIRGQWTGMRSQQAPQGGPMQGAPMRGNPGYAEQTNLTVGQTITVSSTQGKFYVVGDTKDNGTASGT